VVVDEFGQLCHYWRNNDINSYPWTKTYCFGTDITSTPSMIQNTFGSHDINAGDINAGDFEVLVRQGPAQPNALGEGELCRYTRDNTETLEWQVPQIPCFGYPLKSAPALTESRIGSYGHFEVVAWTLFETEGMDSLIANPPRGVGGPEVIIREMVQ